MNVIHLFFENQFSQVTTLSSLSLYVVMDFREYSIIVIFLIFVLS